MSGLVGSGGVEWSTCGVEWLGCRVEWFGGVVGLSGWVVGLSGWVEWWGGVEGFNPGSIGSVESCGPLGSTLLSLDFGAIHERYWTEQVGKYV